MVFQSAGASKYENIDFRKKCNVEKMDKDWLKAQLVFGGFLQNRLTLGGSNKNSKSDNYFSSHLNYFQKYQRCTTIITKLLQKIFVMTFVKSSILFRSLVL